MSDIHCSATIDPSAELADDVTVGPHCVIEGAVRLGTGCRLAAQVFLKGPLTIGTHNRFYPNAALGYEPQDRSFDPECLGAGTVIGNDNIFREGVSIHRATGDRPTTVGNDNYLMVNAHLGHDVVIGDHNTLGNGTLIAGHAQIADHCVFGGNSAIHQFVRIGRLSMISGVSAVDQDVPPFCTVFHTRFISSLNLVGLRRGGYREHIRPLKKAFEIFYGQSHANTQSCDLIEQAFPDDPLCMEFVKFIRNTRRGITPRLGQRRDTR